jgi:phospholipase/lecithinase/hemolysin
MNKFLVALVLLLFGFPASAGDDHHHSRTVYVFGDSLSDNGNFVVLYPNTFFPIFQPPTALPRCSNGPMWPDYLGEMIGQPITPVVDGGNNYAIAAATISPENPSTFDAADTGYAMVDRFLAKYGKADPEAIYIIWLGGNDLDWPASFEQHVFDTLVVMVGRLYDAGARRFLIPNMFNEGSVPLLVQVFQLSPTYLDELTQMTLLWSNLLDTLPTKFPDANIRISDVRRLYLSIDRHPRLFGFTNTTDACFHDWTTLAVCADPHDYLFWDESHPSTHTHKLIASLFALDLLIAGDISLEDFKADRN